MSKTEPKKQRKARRNYERELASLKMWAQVSVDVMSEIIANAGATATANMEGQVAALKLVLVKLEGTK